MPQTVQYALVVDYLTRLRLERGLLQSDVAKRLGKGQQFVSRVENKLRRLDVVEFMAYVKALDGDPIKAFAEVYAQLPQDLRI